MKTIHCVLLTLATLSSLHADMTGVGWSNTVLFRDFLGTPLSRGSSAEFDGALLQLGYYSLATDSEPFAGTWVALTGLGSNNSILSSIGDDGGNRSNGFFKITSFFDPANSAIGNDLPSSSVPLSIRFYDGVSAESSTYYNAVSKTNGAWNWLAPSTPPSEIGMDVGGSGLKWEGEPEASSAPPL